MIKDYYEKFDATDGYDRLLFRTGKGLQSRELNDLQSQVHHQVKGIADILLKDGDLVSEGDVIINRTTGSVHMGEASVYLAGVVRPLQTTELTIPLDKELEIGAWLDYQVVTELQDETLRDPAVGAHNYDEPGAARLQANCSWGLADDVKTGTPQFYPVHRVVNGVLIVNEPSPQLDTMTRALARYDRQSNGGSYVVEGMELIYRGHTELEQTFTLKEGKAHIEGFEVAFQTARQQIFDYDPDIREVAHEPHRFTSDSNGQMLVRLNFSPVSTIHRVTVLAEKSIDINRSNRAYDSLTDDGIYTIVSVKEGDKVYDELDYSFLQNRLVWEGDKPASGNTYQITYHYYEQVMVSADECGFLLSQQNEEQPLLIVEGKDIAVDYNWKMPRKDLVVLDKEGSIKRVIGRAAPFNPIAPRAPEQHLVIAQINQAWWQEGAPDIVDLAIHAVSMSVLKQMQQQIIDLYQLVAVERLYNNANAEDPSSKFGVFVDPFLDDDLRDQGLPQTAAIIDGELQLPISVVVNDLGLDSPVTLPYVLTDVLVQVRRSGSMKVNPYQAFDPIPASVLLTPNVDHWTQNIQNWTSSITERFTIGGGLQTRVIARSSRTQRVSTNTQKLQFLRVRKINFRVNGFGPDEKLTLIEFDGVSVNANGSNITADGNGVLQNSFQIPPNIPTGNKLVRFVGQGGSVGQANYIGSNNISVETMRTITTITSERYDPLAQTFTLQQACFVAGIELWFTQKGREDVRVQIRETTIGMPNQTVLAESIMASSAINLDGVTTLFEFFPLFLNEGQEYAIVVLTDGAEHEVAIAELGKFDPNNGWITSQAYQVGVLLSSSNASTWTPHQDKDLTFRLKAASFSQAEHEIELGQISVDEISDVMALGVVERPSSDTDVRFEFLEEGQSKALSVQEWQPNNLVELITKPVTVKACLSGSTRFSPILYAGAQAVFGKLKKTADYISRAIECQAQGKITVTFEMVENSQVEVFLQQGDGWLLLTLQQSKLLGDGWEMQTFILEDIGQLQTRVKLELSGDTKHRPKVRSLRAFST